MNLIEQDLNKPEEISVGTTRLVRLMRIGRVYHVEQLMDPPNGTRWTVIIRSDESDGCDARHDGIVALNNANAEIAVYLASNRKRNMS